MKKFITLALFILVSFSLFGCDLFARTESTDSLTTASTSEAVTSTTTTSTPFSGYIGYATNLQIEQTIMPLAQRLPEQFFYARYTEVKFNPVTKDLCFHVLIGDTEYIGANYYLVGRVVGSTLNEDRTVFRIASSTADKSFCLNNIDLSEDYEVLIAKSDQDDLNSSSTIFSVSTLTLYDPAHESRGRVVLDEIVDNSPNYLLTSELPYIDLSIQYEDVHRCIEHIEIVLFADFNKEAVRSIKLDIDESYYTGDILNLTQVLFEELSPNMDYLIQLFISGNDGVDDFTDVTLDTFAITSSTYENVEIEDSYNNLYAAITGTEVVGDQVVFSYNAVNDGSYIYKDTQVQISMLVSIYNGSEITLYNSYSLDMESHSFSVPIDELMNGAIIQITDLRHQYVFSNLVISPNTIPFIIYYTSSNGLIHLEIGDYSFTPPSELKLDIVDSNGNIIETFNHISSITGPYDFSPTANVSAYSSYHAVISYQVDTLIGVFDREFESDLIP